MKIKRVRATAFMCHQALERELPDSGVVLVTGQNGHGKSALVEVVATALWGKTLRGTEPWRDGEDGQAEVHAQLGEVVVSAARARRGAKTRFQWTGPAAATEYETLTKAQEGIEALIGPFDLWRRTHVFSSRDAANFTEATDGERKRLLESILGLGRFDAALSACRADLQVEEGAWRAWAAKKERALLEIKAAEQRLQEAEEALRLAPPAPPDAEVERELTALEKLISSASRELPVLRTALHDCDLAGASSRAQLRELERRIEALRVKLCPACGQPIPARNVAELEGQAEELRKRGAEEAAGAGAKAAGLRAELQELEEELVGLRERRTRLAAARDQAAGAVRQRRRLEQTKAEAEEALGKHRPACDEAAEKEGEAAQRVAELQAVERVLGLKGVRAHVLGTALGGIESVANGWLARLVEGDVSVRLRPYAEKKTGGVTDSISLEVAGYGGGKGYRATSGGQRRRVDVALLLALAEVAAAAQGGAVAGTLFFDEVFDALDEGGVEATLDVLDQLAADRAVVVITHNRALIERLPHIEHWHLGG